MLKESLQRLHPESKILSKLVCLSQWLQRELQLLHLCAGQLSGTHKRASVLQCGKGDALDIDRLQPASLAIRQQAVDPWTAIS